MTRGRLVIAGTTLVALVASTAAIAAPDAGLAQNVRLSGGVPGDDEAIVRVTTVQVDGTTKVVKRFRFKKVVAVCDGTLQRISLKTTGRVPVDQEDRTFSRAYGGSVGGIVKVEGRVSRDGGRIAGAFNARKVVVDGLGTCKVETQAYRVRAGLVG